MTQMLHETHCASVMPGNYDGVHRGHQAILQRARQHTRHSGDTTCAMLFDPHPLQVLAPSRAPRLLTTIERRRELLSNLGVGEIIVQTFDPQFALLSPHAFVRDVLVARAHPRVVLVGPDFHFGHQRSGNIDVLRALGTELGFDVEVVEPVSMDGTPISSSRIRDALSEGNVTLASMLLGRAHDVDGTVVHGDQRGRTIGFPTANVACDPVMLPANGVYAVVGRRLSTATKTRLHGVANLGTRPTFDTKEGSEPPRLLEVHWFDFDASIYEERIRVGFLERLRPEQRFESIDALRSQITKDADTARALCANANEELVQWI